MNKTIATIKGTMNSSIQILVDTLNQVGDVISFNDLSIITPRDANYTKFFYDCIDFCKINGDSRLFRIDRILRSPDFSEIQVSPIILHTDPISNRVKGRYSPYSGSWY